jgi:hypothetical protein
MNITYVTALYNIYSDKYTTTRLEKDSVNLLNSKLNVIIYVDDYYNNLIKKIGVDPNIEVILSSLDELYIYNMIMRNKYDISLPTNRNQSKDTYEYLSLMNTKIEFMYKSLKLVKTDYIAWIDAGVNKHFTDPKYSFGKLENIKLNNINTTLIPGCYNNNISFTELCTNVWWVFSGTFFISHKNYVDTFYKLSLESINKFISKGYISWEVNIWVDIFLYHPESIVWYYGNHNDSLINIPNKYLL